MYLYYIFYITTFDNKYKREQGTFLLEWCQTIFWYFYLHRGNFNIFIGDKYKSYCILSLEKFQIIYVTDHLSANQFLFQKQCQHHVNAFCHFSLQVTIHYTDKPFIISNHFGENVFFFFLLNMGYKFQM